MSTLTAAQAVQAAYPAQYYGFIDGNKISVLVDVWSAETITGIQFNIFSLPSASNLV